MNICFHLLNIRTSYLQIVKSLPVAQHSGSNEKYEAITPFLLSLDETYFLTQYNVRMGTDTGNLIYMLSTKRKCRLHFTNAITNFVNTHMIIVK